MKRHQLEFPARPYVPPTAFFALAACAACALLLDAGWRRRAEADIVPLGLVGALAVAGCVVACIGMRAGGRLRRALLLASTGLIAGAISSSIWLARWQDDVRALSGRAVSSFDLVVQGDPSVSDFGASSTAQVIDRDSGGHVAAVRVTSVEPLENGARLRAVGRVRQLDASGWARSRFMKGEVAGVQLVRVLEERKSGSCDAIGVLRSRAIEAIGPERGESRALLAGTICGRTTELNQTVAQEVFSRCGLSHLVAVSGSHLAFISLLLNTVMERLGARGLARRAVSLAVMAGYVAFTGFAASAIRSVVMVGASMTSVSMGRRAHPLSGLSCTVGGLVLVNPGVVYDLGFQLSAMSVLFLLLFGRYIAFHLERIGLPGLIAEPLALTLVAQWATLPLTIPVFGEASVVAPLANLVVGPIMSALLVAGLVAVPIAMLGAGFALTVPDLLANASMFLAGLCSDLPYAAIAIDGSELLPLVAYGTALIVFVLWLRLSRAALLCACAFATCLVGGQIVRWSLLAPASVTVLDVGQADAILIREGSSAVLVDAGVDEAVVTALARQHVFSLDAVVITHWDRDHWGGLPDVLDLIPTDRVIVADGAREHMPSELASLGIECDEVSQGDRLRIGFFSCEVIWPERPVAGEENAESLCLDVTYGDGEGRSLDMLLTGDTEREELAEYAKEVGDVDVLKVGHHGSAVSVASEPLETLHLELAIASAGEGNSYGHPDPDCVALLEQAGARFLCTKDVGDVVVEPGESGPVVRVTGI